VVGRPRGLAAGSGPCLARLHPPVRPGAHRPLRQADPGLDHPTAAASRAGRPLDLAGAGRLHPTPAGPRHRRRPTPAMGAAPPDRQAVPLPGAAGFPPLLAALGSPAAAPKPAGRSPGRPKGSCPGPAARYPAIKKAPKKHRNRQATASTTQPPTCSAATSAPSKVKTQAKTAFRSSWLVGASLVRLARTSAHQSQERTGLPAAHRLLSMPGGMLRLTRNRLSGS
jgi:hypothetical protein